ncbi:MAG: cytochrome ubiquinol oxidase subunit I [Thermoanaerobaculia bacterium]|nr:cytochrome ubiquinol oxidase subunit I [Thermoanaerobaculia bacterium]
MRLSDGLPSNDPVSVEVLLLDAVLLARLQFAITIMFHFLFPPISMGLALLIVIIETMRVRTGNDLYRRMSDFWLKIFAVNFVVGVATGIVMEFQFGTNWASYSRFVGDIFGAPLAAEGVLAFFLESGFLGLLLFGRKKMSSAMRWIAAFMVWLGTTLSAFWILVANSWMQTPAGYTIVGGRAELTDFAAAVFNPSMIQRFTHTLASAWVCGAFVMIGIAAWLMLRGRGSDVARASLRIGIMVGVVSCFLVMLTGDQHAKQVARTQEAKFAAMEGLYSTRPGAPLILFSLPPTQEGPREGPELVITNFTSFLAFGNFQAPVKGLDEFPREEWPPIALTFLSFHNMVILGNVMLLEVLVGAWLLWRGKLDHSRRWLRIMLWSIPLPTLAIQFGWAAAEIGRQPWIVYGVMKTSDGVSKVVSAPEILFSTILFSLIYALLGALWIFLLHREVDHGPELGEGDMNPHEPAHPLATSPATA